jgi:hypothetical protein
VVFEHPHSAVSGGFLLASAVSRLEPMKHRG